MLRFASLGSGSKGNGTLVEDCSTSVLIDCGFSVKETEQRLRRLGRSPSDLSAILVTHEHGDHIRGVSAFARKHGLPAWLTHGTALATGTAVVGNLCQVVPQQSFSINSLSIMPVAVPHDAREPVQYVISSAGRKVGVLTDLGSITTNVLEHYRDCDGLVLEANHDVEMLAQGRYPPSLKRRVGGDWGHLNNFQSARLLSQLESRKIQSLVLGHISLQNNCQTLVAEAFSREVDKVGNVLYACQEEGFPWQTVE